MILISKYVKHPLLRKLLYSLLEVRNNSKGIIRLKLEYVWFKQRFLNNTFLVLMKTIIEASKVIIHVTIRLTITAWKVSVFGVFLVRLLGHSEWIWSDTIYLSVSSSNAGKYAPEKLQIRTFFTQSMLHLTLLRFSYRLM